MITKDRWQFWGRVHEAVGASGLSKCEIARRGGFHRQNLNTRNGMMTVDTLRRFCEVTNTSADWLLGLEETIKKCGECKWLCGEKSTVGIECLHPDRPFVLNSSSVAHLKPPSARACKRFEKKEVDE